MNIETVPRAYFFCENGEQRVRFICPTHGCGPTERRRRCGYREKGMPFGDECTNPHAILTALQAHSRLFISTMRLADSLTK